MSDVLNLSMNGVEVGLLKKYKSGKLEFSYVESWIEHPGARSISLSMPINTIKHSGNVVFNFFDNLLPNNNLIRERIISKLDIDSSHPFDILRAIGKDCIGAIQLSTEVPNNVKQLNYDYITPSKIQALLSQYEMQPLGMNDDNDFRISLAGAQEKTALLKIGNRWAIPKGPTPTTHIIKLPIGKIPHSGIDLQNSCENEHLCLEIARAFGLPTAASTITNFGSQKTLVVERFDRKWSNDKTWIMRLPQEDFCQALSISPAKKYQSDGGPNIADAMKLLTGSQHKEDKQIFFRTQILFWLLAAIDGHAKNFSVFISASNKYYMTPLYDIISAHPLIANRMLEAKKIKMAMSVKSKNTHWKWHTIRARHFIEMSKHINYSQRAATDDLEYMLDSVPSVIHNIEAKPPKNVPDDIVDQIITGINQTAKHA